MNTPARQSTGQSMEWFRQKYPTQYAAGAEMRIYD